MEIIGGWVVFLLVMGYVTLQSGRKWGRKHRCTEIICRPDKIVTEVWLVGLPEPRVYTGYGDAGLVHARALRRWFVAEDTPPAFDNGTVIVTRDKILLIESRRYSGDEY